MPHVAARWRRSLVLTVLAVTACGGPITEPSATAGNADASAVYQKFANMHQPERTQELVDAAKKEGQVTIYGTDSLGEAMGAEFTKKYGIKVNFLDGESDESVARIVQEADAGKYNVDITNGGQLMLEQLQSKGILGDYSSAFRNAVVDGGKGPQWTGYRRQPFVVAYNTTVIDPTDLPDDLLGFADPKWKDKIAVVLNDYDWYMGMVMYYESNGMPRPQIDDAFRKIATNAKIIKGHSNLVPLLAAGQFGVALSSYVHHVAEQETDGAPVMWGGHGNPVVQPIVMRYEGVALASYAPHPAAATLFMDFVLGPDGEAIVRGEGQLPAAPAPEGDPLEGLTTSLLDNAEFAANNAKWANEWDALLRTTH